MFSDENILLVRGPRNFNRSAVSMFFLEVNQSMRRDTASGFVVLDLDGWIIRAERFEDDLTSLTPPDFDDVLMHELVGIFAGTDGDRLPRNLDAVPVSSCLCPTRAGVIGRNDQLQPRIHNGKGFRIALNFEKLCVDPAVVVSTVFILVCHPDPVVRVRAPNQFDVGSPIEGEQIKVFCARSITATEFICGDLGFQTFDGGDGR